MVSRVESKIVLYYYCIVLYYTVLYTVSYNLEQTVLYTVLYSQRLVAWSCDVRPDRLRRIGAPCDIDAPAH